MMLQWMLLAGAVLLAAMGVLNVAPVPDAVPWRLGVLAGEYGHWLAVVALGVAGTGWWARATAPATSIATCAVGIAAAGLLLRPSFSAWRIGRELPAVLERQFGPMNVAHAPFSLSQLAAAAPGAVASRTVNFTPELALDFFSPVGRTTAPVPCIVIVHGGGWDSGERSQIPQLNSWLAHQGYAVAAISYRLAPKNIWPAQRDDLLAAISFLKTRAHELAIDPARLVLLGRSAGGQIVEATAYAAHDAAIRGIVALYAPSDLNFGYAHAREDDALRSPTLMRKFLGGPPETTRANYDSASALNFVSRASPPTLLLHGEQDTLVWHRHSVRLAARLTEEKVPHVFLSLPWATHAFEYNLNGPGGQLTTFALEWFLRAVTR